MLQFKIFLELFSNPKYPFLKKSYVVSLKIMTWKTLGVGDFTMFVRDRFVREGYGVRVKALTTS